MVEIISLDERRRMMTAEIPLDLPDELLDERFLVAEGLDLIADYRAIADDEIRHSIRMLVRHMASNQGELSRKP